MPYSMKVLLLVAAVGSASGGRPVAGQPLVVDNELHDVGLTRFWEAKLPLAAKESVRRAHLIDEALYVVTTAGRLFALTADEGLLRWGAQITAPDFTIYAPTHVRSAKGTGPVVIPTTTKIIVLDRFSGALLTSFAPPFAAGSAAVASGSAMFVGSSDGRFYSLLFDTRGSTPPVKLWEVLAGGPVTASPLLVGRETLIFASQSGVVYACVASNKTLLWTYRAIGPIVADPAADPSGVYVAGTDRSLYKLDLATGSVRWRMRFSKPLFLGPAVTAHTVYQFCAGSGLTAIDADTGKEKWRQPQGLKLAAHAPAGDVLFTIDGRLLVVDHETGKLRGAVHVQGVIDVVTNTHDDAVYLVGDRNRVLCLRLDDTPYLRRQQVMAARRRLNLPPGGQSDRGERLKREGPGKTDPLADDPLRSRRDLPP